MTLISATVPGCLNGRSNGNFRFSADVYTVDESAESVLITVVRDSDRGAVSIDYSTADGTATAGRDYEASSGKLTFTSGQDQRTFDVAIIDDSLLNGNRTFTVHLGNPIGKATIVRESVTVTILDDDTAPVETHRALSLTPVCPPGMTVVTSIDGTQHCKGPDGYIYEMTVPGETPVRSPDKYQWLGDHPPGSDDAETQSSLTSMPEGTYRSVEPYASGSIPPEIAARMRPPSMDWVAPAYTSTALPPPSLIINPGQSVAAVNDAGDGQLVVVKGDHSSEVITVTRPLILKGEDGAIVNGIDIRAPCIVTGFSVTGREVGIFAQGVSGSAGHPFIIEGNHLYRNGYGLRLYFCNNVLIKDNLIESNSEVELHMEHVDNATITGNDLGEAMYRPGGGSEDVDGAALRYLTNCVFEKNYIGEHYYGTRWYSCKNCIIRDNVYRNSGTNLRLGGEYDQGDYGQCENMQVIGNDIGGGTDAIWAQACVNCVFNGNTLKSKYGFKDGMGRGGTGSGNKIVSVVPSYG